jgi:hypothetical protein
MSNKLSGGACAILRKMMSPSSAEMSSLSPGWTSLSRRTSAGSGTLPCLSTVVIISKKSLAELDLKSNPSQATLGSEEEFAAALNWEEIQELLA